jgi:predicted DNA-binding WGR domain protein
VSGYREIVRDIWIAIEELVSLAENHIAAKKKNGYGDSGKAGRPACSITAMNAITR